MGTRIRRILLPCDDIGNDPNDYRNDGQYMAVITKAEGRKQKPNMGWIDSFKLTNTEVNELCDPSWIYKDLIIAGHFIAIPAAPGAGKTTILMYVSGELAQDNYDVIYVNADVGSGDVKTMQALADTKGFHLLLPDMKAGLSMDDVVRKIEDMNALDADYSNMVFIFDTLKKMTDVISKSKSKALYKTLRGLTAKGMTIVVLAHTNKYDDGNGKPIYEGTGDLRSDVDELIYLIPKESEDGSLTVSTDPLSATAKRRGTHQPITFHISADRKVSRATEYVDTAAQINARKQYEEDESVIEAITEAMLAGKFKQVEIVDWCREQHSIGRKTVERVLKRYLYRLWKRDRGFQKNAWNYELLDDKSTPPEGGTN